MNACRCDQTVDACLVPADGSDGLCGFCRDLESLCGKRRVFGEFGEVVNRLRAEVDREGG